MIAYCIPRVYFKKHRQQAISIHATCVGLGTIITPFLIGVLLRAGKTWQMTMMGHYCLISAPLILSLSFLHPVKLSTDDGDSSKPEADADKTNVEKSAKITGGNTEKELKVSIEKKPTVADKNDAKSQNASQPCKPSHDGGQKKQTRKSVLDREFFADVDDKKLEKLTWSNAWLFGLYALVAGGAGGIFSTFTPYILVSVGLKEGQMYLLAPILCSVVFYTSACKNKNRFDCILSGIICFTGIASMVALVVCLFKFTLPSLHECMQTAGNLTQLQG